MKHWRRAKKHPRYDHPAGRAEPATGQIETSGSRGLPPPDGEAGRIL